MKPTIYANICKLRLFAVTMLVTVWLLPSGAHAARLYVNAADYPSINEAVRAARGKTVLVKNKQVLTANLTIPRDVSLEIAKEGLIVKNSNASLAINGPFTAGLYQVFANFNSDDVRFGAGSVQEAYPQWWGAKGDSHSDDKVALQGALSSGAKNIFIGGGGTFMTSDQLSIPPDVSVEGDGATTVMASTWLPLKGVFLLNGTSMLNKVRIDANCSFHAGVIRPDGAEFGVMVKNSNDNVVKNCMVKRFKTVGILVIAWDVSAGDEAHNNTIEGNMVESYDFVNAGQGIGGLNISIRGMHPAQTDEVRYLKPVDKYNYAYVSRCSGNKVINNSTRYGLHGIIVYETSNNIITGNKFDQASAGNELTMAVHNSFSDNIVSDSGSASLGIQYGSRHNIIAGNTFFGTHGSYNYALGLLYGADHNVVKSNTFDSRFDRYAGRENRVPGAGILVAQYCRDNLIQGNRVKGYRYGIWARTMMYPGVVRPTDLDYYLTGFSNLHIEDNIIQGAYVLTKATGHRLALPQNSLYGIWLNKNSIHDDIKRGSMINSGIILEGNLVDGVEYPYVISEAVSASPNPARFEGVVFQNNKAVNCTSAAGLPNYAQYVNVQLSKYRGINNSWNFIAKGSGAPPATALFGYGERVAVTNRDANDGSTVEYIFRNTGKFKPVSLP